VPWPGFEDSRVIVGGAEYAVTLGGQGPPLLLLHGRCRPRAGPPARRRGPGPARIRCLPRTDRHSGRRIAAPLLVVTGADEPQLADAPEVWAAWADDVTAARVPGGHFVPEEAPEELVAVLVPFLDV
jgi:pimeloyl-ACP methyl ester carboxylesterase